MISLKTNKDFFQNILIEKGKLKEKGFLTKEEEQYIYSKTRIVTQLALDILRKNQNLKKSFADHTKCCSKKIEHLKNIGIAPDQSMIGLIQKKYTAPPISKTFISKKATQTLQTAKDVDEKLKFLISENKLIKLEIKKLTKHSKDLSKQAKNSKPAKPQKSFIASKTDSLESRTTKSIFDNCLLGGAAAYFSYQLTKKIAAVAVKSGSTVMETIGFDNLLYANEAIPLVFASAFLAKNGIQDIANKKYSKGALELLSGIGGLLGSGCYIYSQLPQRKEICLLTSYTTDNPEQLEMSRLVKENQQNYTKQNESSYTVEELLQRKEICLFTSYTTDNPERLEMSRLVKENHQNYAKQHGYSYTAHEKNLAPDVLPYWSKIAGIQNYLEGKIPSCPNPEWIVWLDDDALVTNPAIKMEDFIQGHQTSSFQPDIIVTQDVGGPSTINTGVLIVKNSEASRNFFQDLWEMRHKKSLSAFPYTYGSCPNQICLHEQEAMQHLIHQKEMTAQGIVKIIGQHDPQNVGGVGLNVFQRFNHIDVGRDDLYLNYSEDRPENIYQPGDFITQCTGLATKGYRAEFPWEAPPEEGLKNLRLECIQDVIRKSAKTLFSSVSMNLKMLAEQGSMYFSG